MSKHMTIKIAQLSLAILVGLAVALGPLGVSPAHAVFYYFDFSEYIPCAGETIHFTGFLHVATHETVDDTGGVHFTIHFQEHLTGIGLTTGVKYESIGGTQDNYGNVGSEETSITRFRLISQGRGPNIQSTNSFHFTINANGDVTVSWSKFSFECQ